MKLAYLILAHTDAPHLRRLVTALSAENTAFFVHVDKKVDESPFRESCAGIPNVTFVKNRKKVYWGGWSIIAAEIEIIKEALRSDVKFDRFALITGTDYPIWSNNSIEKELSNNPNKEYIKCYNLTKVKEPKKVRQRVTTYHFRDLPVKGERWRHYIIGGLMVAMNHSPIRKNKRAKINGKKIDVYGGTQWWILTRGCMQQIVETVEKDKDLRRYFKTSFAPEEMMPHTIIMNSKYRDNVACYTEDGIYPGLEGAAYTHYIEYRGGQKTFTEKDYDLLLSSGRMFFRKVQTGVSDSLMDRLDERRRC